MKRNIGYAIALLTLATGLSAPLPAQQPTPEKSDLIDSSAMDALNQMGTYLRSLKDFQVKANVTSEDVLEDGEKLGSQRPCPAFRRRLASPGKRASISSA